ncbi:hypothetical protein G7Y89_g8795 [Cudoniella acicularis]|uniref:DJ-1/PfpI domain-containing protein n=1 Tax=Cudoniella acicularis TaxID=354080 RepID=A0A8H4RHI6_9HELO|nr:hypothetical protein G7Y89_g8795 [Cudoniella acicularis]
MFSFKHLNRIVSLLVAFSSYVRCDNTTAPTRFGVIVFPGFEALDVFGPLDALNLNSYDHSMNLTIIAETLHPVRTNHLPWIKYHVNSTFGAEVLPTHTFETAPPLDVLLVPGGLGTRAPSPLLNSTIAFVKERYPTLQYLLTVCTGAGIVARAGVLDGKFATTNKRAWEEIIVLGPKVKWVPKARWVVDGNIWTSSGVSAGIDLTIAFIASVWGNATATSIANGMEYVAITDSHNDPFSGLYNLTMPAVQP